MDFSWEALEGANARLRHIRQRLVEWRGDTDGPAETARTRDEFDRRFRDAIASDLDMPAALVVVNEVVSTDRLPGPWKYALLTSWDSVLALDVDRMAREGFETPADVSDLVQERDDARKDRDFARSDEIRDRLAAMGWEVMDTPDGTKVRPRT